jgi:hypothetical protein
MIWAWLALAIVALVALVLLLTRVMRPRHESASLAQQRFLQQREHLEAAFLRAARSSGKPRGLRWKACDWEPEVVLARDRKTGQLTALVGVSIRFEAIEGSDMEGLPAVGNLRNASGVFYLEGGRWRTTGRAVFNLNPCEALEHFKLQYERVEV